MSAVIMVTFECLPYRQEGGLAEVPYKLGERVKDPSLSWDSVATKYIGAYNAAIKAYANFARKRQRKGEGAEWPNVYAKRN